MRDITLEDTIYLNFTTRSFSTGVPTVLSGSPALSVLESNNATPITAGVSLQTDRASVVGLNQATIVATAANGYEAGKSYSVYISAGTVGGVSVVGEVVGQFTIQASAAAVDLANATDGLGALKTEIGTRLATSGYTAPDNATITAIAGYLDTEVAAIKAKTDNLPAAPAATGDIPTAAAIRAEMDANSTKLDVAVSSRLASAGYTAPDNATITAIAGYLDTEVAAIKAKTDSLTFTEAGKVDANLLSIGGNTTAAAAFKRAVLGNTVGTIGSGSTTTSLVPSSLTPAASVADQFKGRIVTFAQDTTTAALRGQATDITASTDAGVLTVTALTTAPVSGDTFAIT